MALTRQEVDVLRMLRRSAEPLSGRQVADVAGVAPNTANRILRRLEARGLAQSVKEGRATLWTSSADAAFVEELAGDPQQRVALVVTAVELEHTEVRNRLLNTERVRVADIWMVKGQVPGDHIDWTVYLARAGMGNSTSAALVGRAVGDLGANLVAFVGTAAGLKRADQKHLDVVVASRIHNAHAGKQVPGASETDFLGRAPTYHVPAPLLSVVNACIEDSAWTSAKNSPFYDAKHAQAYVAPIVSVEAVQADSRGPIMHEVRRRFQDAAALDMESFGLAAGSDVHDLPVLAVRGLSDFADDKSEDANDERQPPAAANAARLLRDILRFADPDDFRRGIRADPSSQGPRQPPEPGPPIRTPGALQGWIDRLRRRSATRADAMLAYVTEMKVSGTAAATWFSRAFHRPPAWLREDDTGDAWGFISSLASLAGSKIAWRGFERAAAAARLTGDEDADAYFTLVARLERIARESDTADGTRGPGPEALNGLDDKVVVRFAAVIDFYRAVLEQDLAKAKMNAEIAVAAFGLNDPSGVLRDPEVPVEVVDVDPALTNLLAASVLRQLARMMLIPGAADNLGVESGLAARTQRGNSVTRDLADDGLRLAQWAASLCPNSEGLRLTYGQLTLAVLVSMTGRASADVDDAISRRARSIESDALEVRDVFRDWDGPSGEAVAVAARARSLQGDSFGALRLLLPAPDGVASQDEAKHPDVLRLGAFLARVLGRDDLALELASRNPDRVEGKLIRAAVLDGRPQMVDEAKRALFAALVESADRADGGFRPLMALSRRFNSLNTTEQAIIRTHIDAVGQVDPQLADVMRAWTALSEGDEEVALRYVRALVPNELVLEAHAEALIAGGRAEEAARLMFDEGLGRGDIPMAMIGLQIATDNALPSVVQEFGGSLLSRDDIKPVRLRILRALQETARDEKRWQEVVLRTEQVIQESDDTNLPAREADYWFAAEALYFQEKFAKALNYLLDAPAVSFSQREKAQIFLSILKQSIDEQRTLSDADPRSTVVSLGESKVYAMFARAAADWADDEQIAALAMSVVLTTPGANLSEVQIAEFRDYAEKYFERHGENTTIKQFRVEGDDIDSLIDFLRAEEPRQKVLGEITREVRAGRLPLAALTELAGRTCTESLIRRDLGYVMAVGADEAAGLEAARAALGSRVVIDTTALVVASWTGLPFRKLAAHLDSVLLPAPLRADIARARSSLAMKSTSTLGWDAREQRPVMSEITTEQAQVHADAVEQVWADVRGLQVVPVASETSREQWLSAVTLARESGLAVWADDVAMRQLARSMGANAFGTLDLVKVVENEAGVAAAITALRGNRVVDIPINEPWIVLAGQTGWRIDSWLATAIARPTAWRNVPLTFAQFQSLIRFRPQDMSPQDTVSWAYLAATGLATATIPLARPKVVSALLAWVALFADPLFSAVRDYPEVEANLPQEAGLVTRHVIAAAEALGGQHFAGANALESLIDIVSEGLIATVGPETTSRLIGALVSRLDEETAHRVFAAYIKTAGK